MPRKVLPRNRLYVKGWKQSHSACGRISHRGLPDHPDRRSPGCGSLGSGCTSFVPMAMMSLDAWSRPGHFAASSGKQLLGVGVAAQLVTLPTTCVKTTTKRAPPAYGRCCTTWLFSSIVGDSAPASMPTLSGAAR